MSRHPLWLAIGVLATFALSTSEARAQQDATGSAYVNAGGLLGLGLTPTVELGGSIAGFARLRLLGTGVLSHLVIADPSEDETLDLTSFTLGGGVHFYPSGDGSQRGFFVGPWLEYGRTVVEDDSWDMERYTTTVLVFGGDVGYRWVFGKFALGVGASLGYASVLSSECEVLDGWGECGYPEEDQVFFTPTVDLGFVF